MSYIGTTEIGKMFLGSVEIDKAYLGDDLVFSSSSGPAPTPTPVFYDRLVFDGTAYIDTDISCENGYSFNVYLGNETVKATQRVFLISCANSTYLGLNYTSNTNTTSRRFGIYYGSAIASSNRTLNWTTTSFNFFLTPKRFGWGSTAYTFTKGSNAPTSSLVLGAISTHGGQSYTGRMGTFYVYGSDAQNVTNASGFSSYTPLYTLRPCTYDGKAGMWCVETSKFYGNTAGAGTLSVANL